MSSLLDTIFRDIYTIVIGKAYSSADLGIYTNANRFAQFPSSNLTSIMQRVTYPLLCEFQDENERLRYLYRKYLRLSAYVIFPLMVGLAAVAHPLLIVLLTEKWTDAVPLLQILCIAMMWYPIHSINLNLLQVKGRTDLMLSLEIVKKVVLVIVLCITIPQGIIWMCIGQIISSMIALVINTYYTRKLINLGFFKQMQDLVPAILYSSSMGFVVYISTTLIADNILKVAIGIIVGILYYIIISKLTNSEELQDVLSLLKFK